jgi:hypothetical protein
MTVSEVAKKYLGQSELEGNVFTTDTELGKKLKEAGHNNGEAWCAYFAEAVFCEAYPNKEGAFRKMFSAGAVRTLENFKRNGYTIFEEPQEGMLVIWQSYKDGKPSWTGHAGVVIDVLPNGAFITIEGNTTAAGSREGTSVQIKTRSLKRVNTGLNVLGFVKP